jgi:hypothetical protein
MMLDGGVKRSTQALMFESKWRGFHDFMAS